MKTIMLVDDSTTVLLSLTAILEKAGYSVRRASRADAALQELQAGFKPDLVITDLHMPGMDGIAFIQALRKLPNHRFVPILFLTTESHPEKRLEAKAAGASGWLVKPVQADDLLGVLKQVLR